MSRKLRKDPRYQLLTIVVLLVFWGLGKWLEPYLPRQDQQASNPAGPGAVEPGVYEILRVVDGDTMLLKRNHLRVRLQGVDTPETVKEDTPVQAWGPEATAFTKRFVADAGGRLKLTVDGEAVDQYGRHLVFAWHDGKLLNEELVAAGLARAKLAYDYGQSLKNRLRRAQEKAQAERLGIWSR